MSRLHPDSFDPTVEKDHKEQVKCTVREFKAIMIRVSTETYTKDVVIIGIPAITNARSLFNPHCFKQEFYTYLSTALIAIKIEMNHSEHDDTTPLAIRLAMTICTECENEIESLYDNGYSRYKVLTITTKDCRIAMADEIRKFQEARINIIENKGRREYDAEQVELLE